MNRAGRGQYYFILICAFIAFSPRTLQADGRPGGPGEPVRVDTILIDQYDLEGVVISAGKKSRPLQEVPAAITSLNALKLERDRVETLRDIGFQVPNLFMPDYGSRLTAPVYIRGVGSRINAPSVGLYIDQTASFEKSGFDFDFLDIERVEVLRGPQGTLYGRNTMGGLIHIITREPGMIRRTRFSADFGNYSQQKIQFSHHQPLLKDRLSLAVGASFNHRNGFHTNEFNDKPIDEMKSGGTRIKLKWNTGPRSFIQWSLEGNRSREGGYPYGKVDEPESTESGITLNYDHESTYFRDMVNSNLWFEKKGEYLTLTSVTGFQWFDDSQDIDQDFTPGDLLYVTQDQVQNLLTQELRLSGGEDRRLSWVSGVYAFLQDIDRAVDVIYGEDGIVMFRLPGPTSKLKTYDMSNRGLAVFGQATVKDILPRLDIALGFRYDRETDLLGYEYYLSMNGISNLSEAFSQSMNFEEVLPKLSLNYRWNRNNFQYISIAKGYKSGGFNSTFERPGDETFDPEFSWNYEMGWKSSWWERKMVLNLALFYVDWDDQQIYQTVPSGQGSMLKNAGKSVSKGFEIESTFRPVNNLVSAVSLGYTDARFVEYRDTLKDIDYRGNFIPYVPRFTYAWNGTYRIPLKDSYLQDIALTLSLQGTGRIYWNESNSLSQSPYSLLGMRLRFGLPFADLTLWADNILQQEYQAFRFTALGNTYAQPGRPFTFGLRLSADF